MGKIHLKRLRNLVRVLREAHENEKLRRDFTMERFGFYNPHGKCGTPACAFGHYAVRRDVQRTFKMDWRGIVFAAGRLAIPEPADFAQDIAPHFGISSEECNELFENDGCGKAQTPAQAANYIEQFIERVSA